MPPLFDSCLLFYVPGLHLQIKKKRSKMCVGPYYQSVPLSKTVNQENDGRVYQLTLKAFVLKKTSGKYSLLQHRFETSAAG
jgi:hypothetical protein